MQSDRKPENEGSFKLTKDECDKIVKMLNADHEMLPNVDFKDYQNDGLGTLNGLGRWNSFEVEASSACQFSHLKTTLNLPIGSYAIYYKTIDEIRNRRHYKNPDEEQKAKIRQYEEAVKKSQKIFRTVTDFFNTKFPNQYCNEGERTVLFFIRDHALLAEWKKKACQFSSEKDYLLSRSLSSVVSAPFDDSSLASTTKNFTEQNGPSGP